MDCALPEVSLLVVSVESLDSDVVLAGCGLDGAGSLVAGWLAGWLAGAAVPPVTVVVGRVRRVIRVLTAALRAAEARRAPLRYGIGFRGVPLTRTSKCTCGPVQLPVQPT